MGLGTEKFPELPSLFLVKSDMFYVHVDNYLSEGSHLHFWPDVSNMALVGMFSNLGQMFSKLGSCAPRIGMIMAS